MKLTGRKFTVFVSLSIVFTVLFLILIFQGCVFEDFIIPYIVAMMVNGYLFVSFNSIDKLIQLIRAANNLKNGIKDEQE